MKNIREFIKQCTDALGNDPQVRLEVEQELSDHLENKVAEERSAGMSEEESEERAIKAFGDAPEISEELYSANVRRMKLHARIRLFIKVAAIPALLLALYFAFDFKNIIFPRDIDDFNTLSSDKSGWRKTKHLNPDQKLIVYGDQSKSDIVARQKAIWERWPDDKVYLANYMNYLIMQDKDSEQKFDYVLKELKKAQQLDPQNASYNYMAAAMLLKKAVKIDSTRIKLPDQNKYEYKTEISIKNRPMLDRAMQEFKAGIAKPYCREYALEMASRRADIICGDNKTMLDQIRRIAVYAGALLPFLQEYRSIGRVIPYYAKLQAEAGHKKEAEFYLNAWKPYIRQLNDGSDTLIAVLVTNAIVAIQEKQVPEIYRILGEPEKAKMAEQELKQAVAVMNNWKQKREKLSLKTKMLLEQKAGLLTAMLLPALGEEINEKMLGPERTLNYIMGEKFMIIAMCLTGLAVIIITLIFMGWNYMHGKRSFIFVPSLKEFLKIIGWGLLAPLAVYFIITRIPLLSGREYNIIFNLDRFSLQAMWFVLGIPAAMILSVSHFIRRRCRATGIDVPPKSKLMAIFLILYLIFSVSLIFYLNSIAIKSGSSFSLSPVPRGFILITAAITALIFVLVPLFWLMFMGSKYSRYKMTLYVNLIPPIILMMLAVSAIIRPCLDREETYLIQNENGIFCRNGFTSIENNLTDRLKAQLKQVMDTLPDQTSKE